MKTYSMLVFTNAVPGRDEEFNRWYDQQHLADVLQVPGFISAQRFRCRPADAQAQPGHRYCAVYTLQTDDVDGSLAELMRRSGTDAMPLNDAMAPDVVFTLYEAITPLLERD